MNPVRDHLEFWQARLDDPCFVYVLRTAYDPAIKIGRAKNVDARIATLQTGNPRRISLLHVLPGGAELEWQLHKKLENDHVLGEWFDGPRVEPFLDWVALLAKKMVHRYDESGQIPDFRKFGSFRHKRNQASEVTVRHVAPAPVDPEIARERALRHYTRNVRGRDGDLGPEWQPGDERAA